MTAAIAALSILVADDEEGIRSLLAHWLRSRGHAVATVGSGCQATQLMKQQCFDLVITDIVMPDGDGLELIATFHKTQPVTRVVAISGGGIYLAGTDCLRVAREFGAHAAVMKPFNFEQLQVGIALAFASPPLGAV
jgi:CheY-like chemotaxis protein